LSQHPLSTSATQALHLLGGLIEEGRIRKGWTRESLAERLGVGVVTLRRLVRGEPGVAAGTYFEAAALLGIPLFEPDAAPAQGSHLAQTLSRQRERLLLLPSRVRDEDNDALPDDF
jgi:transcriptional regulator with XRE-family HTH domain